MYNNKHRSKIKGRTRVHNKIELNEKKKVMIMMVVVVVVVAAMVMVMMVVMRYGEEREREWGLCCGEG